MNSKIKVLVVDDSAFMRKMIADLLSADPVIEVIDKARNGLDGVRKVKELSPDVVTMDVEMPIMNGLEALELLMKNHPLPVVMLSSITWEGAEATIKALELGAVDFIPKPSGSISLDIHKIQEQLIEKVKTAAKARINRCSVKPITHPPERIEVNSSLEIIHKHKQLPHPVKQPINKKIENIILIGTSTGGPKALQVLLSSLPTGIPAAFLIVQHMPPGFTKSLAQRLNSLSEIKVVEAEDRMMIETGCAYIAPGDFHMKLEQQKDGGLFIQLDQNEPIAGHRPSVDVLFRSAAAVHHPSKYAIVMTGMGSDGTKGIAELRKTGCKEAIVEDESTCVVFGMPRAAIQSGNVDKVLPLPQIGPYIAKLLS